MNMSYTFIIAYFFMNLSSPDVNAKLPFMHSAQITATIRSTSMMMMLCKTKHKNPTIVIRVYIILLTHNALHCGCLN